MASQDDLALLKRMYERGEISAEQYDTLRRHVLWGTPLPRLMDEAPADRYVAGTSTVDPARYAPPSPAAGRHAAPNGAGYSAPTPTGYAPTGRRYASRRERREAEEAAAQFPPPPPASAHPFPPDPHAPPPPADAPAFPPLDTHPPPPPELPSLRPPAESPAFPPQAVAPTFPELPSFPPLAVAPSFRPSDEVPAFQSRGEVSAFSPPVEVSAFPGAVEDGGFGPVEEYAFPLAGGEQHGDPAERIRHRRTATADERAERRSRRDPYPDETDDDRPAPGGKRHRSLLAVLTSLVVSLALVAAGVWYFALRTEGVPPSAYARETCGSVRDWQQAVDSSNAALVTQIAREKDRTKIRDAVSAYYTTIAGRTDQLRVTILGHGAAGLDGGRTYADSLAAAIGDRARDLRDLAARAARLDPADAATFQATLPALLTGADTAVSEVSAALARPSAGISTDLRAALSDDPSCAPYVG